MSGPDDTEPTASKPTSGTGTDETIAVEPTSGTGETIAAPAGSAVTKAEDLSGVVIPMRPSSNASGDTLRTVGEEMRDASIERFGEVDRDRFELLGELARGGLGRISRARDPRTGRVVAIKEVLRPHPDIVVRFAREALVTANLQHPSIVPVYEVGRWPNGEPYYAMKLVRGRTLDELIAEAQTIEARVALVHHIIDIADALAYAHSEHVIHRDLKPGNVLVGSYGETVVIDWGLARNVATGEELGALAPRAPVAAAALGETVVGAVVGTPAYMPPEQARGAVLDERADVYAIGAILYHALAGQRPYVGARDIDQLLDAVANVPPRPLVELAPDAPAELIAIATKAMARDPGDRYSTAETLAEDLRRFVAGKLVGAHRYTTWQLIRRWIAHHRAVVVTAVVALVALGVLGIVSVRRIASERDVANLQTEIAQRERSEAQRRFADSLEELGRQALLADEPDRALPLLAGAIANHPSPSPVLRLLAGRARDAYAGLIAIAPAHKLTTTSAVLASDGTRLYTAAANDEIRAWNIGSRTIAWSGTGGRHLELSPDEKLVLSATVKGSVVVRVSGDGSERGRWNLAMRPDEEVEAIAWSPDNDRFAAITTAGRVVSGSLASSTLTVLDPHADSAYALAFSPSGRLFATVGFDGIAIVRDVVTGATVARLRDDGDLGAGTVNASPTYAPQRKQLMACAWADEDRLIVASYGGMVRIWKTTTRQIERRFDHGDWISGLTLDRSTARVIVYGENTSATVWSIESGTVHVRLGPHRAPVDDAEVVGPWIVTSDQIGNLYVWDPETGERIQTLPADGTLNAIAARNDSVVAYGDSRQRVWRLDRDTGMRRLQGHTARVRDVAFDRSGTLWSASNDGSARGFDVTGRTAARVFGAADFSEQIVRSIDDPAGRQPANPRGLRALQLSPDGSLLATCVETGEIVVWNVSTGQKRATWVGHTKHVRRVVFTRDGATAFSVGDTTLRRWEVASGRETGKVELGDTGRDVVVFAGDAVVATLGDDKRRLALWDATTLAARVTNATSKLRDLVVAGDHLFITTEKELFQLDASGVVVRRSNNNLIFTLDVGPRWIADGNARGEITLRDPATLATIRSWPSRDPATVISIRFRPDGTVLATSTGNHVQLWDPSTGHLLASTKLPAVITNLAWSPDGRYLAMAGGAGTIWSWELRPAVDDLSGFARCVSRWRRDDATLVADTFDPAACAVLDR